MKANRYIRQLAADERAVSEVIGAVLVFGILIAVLALVQTQAVPATNEEVEFQHSQKVQTDMAELNEAIALTAAQGRSMSPTLELGMTYPARLFFFNPSPVYGQLRTNAPATVTLRGVTPTEGVNLLYTGGTYNYLTRPIEYRAGYHRFEDEPTVIREVGTQYERYPAGTRIQGGSFINGKQITLVTVNGTLQRNSLSAESVETVPLSAPARTVAVKNDSAQIEITIPTQLSENLWRETLSSQRSVNGGHIVGISYVDSTPYNMLTVSLEQGVTYNLRMASVGVGTQLTEPHPAYLTTISGDNESVVDNGLLQVTIEVRDRFNNPVAGKSVNLTIFGSGNGTFFPSGNSETTVTTSANGRATATYDPPNVQGSRDIIVGASSEVDPSSSLFDPSTDPNDTNISITIADTGGPIGEPPETPPVQFDVTDLSDHISTCLPSGQCINLSGDAAYEVNWEVNDSKADDPDSDLDTVELRLIHDSTSQIVDSVKYDVSGDTASGDSSLINESGANEMYIVKIIYDDKGGYVEEEACNSDLAEGDNDPLGCDDQSP